MKEILYDFFGLNKITFLFINKLSCFEFVREALFWFEKTTTYNAFMYHLALIITLYFLYFLHKRDGVHAKKTIACLIIYGAAMFANVAVIEFLKHFFSFSRPYCSLPELYVVEKLVNYADCFKSFPSGHTAYITVLVYSFMPAMNVQLKWCSSILVVLVMLSRIMIGAHYPADVLWSFAVSFVVVIVTRVVVHYLHHLYKMIVEYTKLTR